MLLTWLTDQTLTNTCSNFAIFLVSTSNVCTKPSSCLSTPDSLCRNSFGEPEIWNLQITLKTNGLSKYTDRIEKKEF